MNKPPLWKCPPPCWMGIRQQGGGTFIKSHYFGRRPKILGFWLKIIRKTFIFVKKNAFQDRKMTKNFPPAAGYHQKTYKQWFKTSLKLWFFGPPQAKKMWFFVFLWKCPPPLLEGIWQQGGGTFIRIALITNTYFRRLLIPYYPRRQARGTDWWSTSSKSSP